MVVLRLRVSSVHGQVKEVEKAGSAAAVVAVVAAGDLENLEVTLAAPVSVAAAMAEGCPIPGRPNFHRFRRRYLPVAAACTWQTFCLHDGSSHRAASGSSATPSKSCSALHSPHTDLASWASWVAVVL